jgi:hypothetical protein
MVKRPVRRRK